MSIDKINVDFEKLFSNKLKLEYYFILYCLVNNEEELLTKYTLNTGGVPTSTFYKLRDSGFIVLKDEIIITFCSLLPTLEAKKLFNVEENLQFDTLFSELLSTYPNKVKRITGGTRRLHNDLIRCKKLYKLTLSGSSVLLNQELHNKIIKCIQLYYKEHLKDNKQEFMQMLASFLHQKTWEQYLPDLDNKVITQQSNNYDSI